MSSLWGAIAFYGLLSASDVTSTQVAQSRGARELNPIMAGDVAEQIAAKAVVTTGLVLLDQKVLKTRKQRWFVRGILGLTYGLVIAHNLEGRQ